MRFLVLIFLAGCVESLQPSLPDLPGCGDGICSVGESGLSCPEDCTVRGGCGDGVCEAGETAASCPVDCVQAPQCDAIALGDKLPLDLSETTAGAPAAYDLASCGDAMLAPARTYAWTAPVTGRYHVSASGAFALVLVVRRGCDGVEASCATATAGSASGDLVVDAGERITIGVTGVAGAAGAFQLDITRDPETCGNFACEASEDCTSCPSDCGVCPPPPPTCGDGVCSPGEDCSSCESDCGTCTVSCGDGVCDAGESCDSCSTDCGSCPSSCGDGTCDAGESCSSCSEDCGTCGPSCGDGTCDAGEDCDSCSEDCGTCAPSCGDGSCDAGEDCDSCSEDCGSCD